MRLGERRIEGRRRSARAAVYAQHGAIVQGWNEGRPTGNDVMHVTRGREARAENRVVVTEALLFRLKVILHAAPQRESETFTDFSRS